MPILNLKLSGSQTKETKNALIQSLLKHTSEILHKKPAVTAITIQDIANEDWIIAGKPLSEHNANSFYLDIKITDETNLKSEKAEYIKNVYDDFTKILGNVHEESYIYIEDVRAASYGYGGKTQEYRYHN